MATGRILATNRVAVSGRDAAPAFNPFSLSNKVAAYLSGQGYFTTAGTVTGWVDHVGGHNFRDPGAGKRATLSLTGGPNSTACMTFDGVNDYLDTGAFTNNQPVHVFAVAKYDTAATSGTLFDGSASNACRLHRTGATEMHIFAGANPGSILCTPQSWHVHDVFFSGAASLYTEDTTVKVTGQDAGSTNMGGLVLGIFGDLASDPAACSIAEFWVFSAQVTGADLTNLRSYFNTKFGVP